MTFLECVFSKGGFSGEAIFRVQPNGEEHVGVASRRYGWTEEGKSLVDVDLEGRQVRGLIAVRIIADEPERVLVSMPDGEVIWVVKNRLILETNRNVSVRQRLAMGD